MRERTGNNDYEGKKSAMVVGHQSDMVRSIIAMILKDSKKVTNYRRICLIKAMRLTKLQEWLYQIEETSTEID